MTASREWRRVLFALGWLCASLVFRATAQVVFTDSFNTNVNYLTNGVAGTIWDGVYFGAGDFVNELTFGPGTTTQCDANITAPSTLTIQSTGTAWENATDDGFYLFKVVTGDFSATVHVVSPFNNAHYNTAGLQARAFAAGGNPWPSGLENYVSWTRFDESFGANDQWANYLRSETNGVVDQINPGDYPNSAYWLRMDRVGNVFRFFQKTNFTDAWIPKSFLAPVNGTDLVRNDLAGLPLQVGIIHATFNGLLGVQFTDFSLVASNLMTVAAPSPAADLTLSTNSQGDVNVSWSPGPGSAGSVVVLWTGSSVVKEAPADGITYNGNGAYGLGDTLPARNYFVAYSGMGTNVTLSNLITGSNYTVAVYSFVGSGSSVSYSHVPVAGSFVAPAQTEAPLIVGAMVQGTNVLLTNNAIPGKWYWAQYTDSLNPFNWQNVGPFAMPDAGPIFMSVHTNGATQSMRFYRVRQFDVPPEGGNLALNALPATSYVSPWENLYAIDDGYTPSNSADHSQGGYGNYNQTGVQWVEYDWSSPINCDMIDVYWWQDGQGIFAPISCSLRYWNGTSFVPVSNPVGLGVALNQFNTTTFSPVTTTKLRLLFQSDTAGHSTGILQWRVYDAGGSPTNWPGPSTNSQFAVKAASGALVSLEHARDSVATEYLAGRLGDVTINYLELGTNWTKAQTSVLAAGGAGTFGWSSDGSEYQADYQITNGSTAALALSSVMDFSDTNAIVWTVTITNVSGGFAVIGDLALPLPMNTDITSESLNVLKHSYIEGNGSFLYWMRPDAVGPYLQMTPLEDTSLEYWDTQAPGTQTFFTETLGGYEVFVHSYASAAAAAAQYPTVTTQGQRWRQPNSFLTLAPGQSQTYGFKFQWVNDYDALRQALVNEGGIETHVVPGMTVPTNLFAEVALRTTQNINSIIAEFPSQTQITFLGTTNVGTNGPYQLYQVQFNQLGENKLTIDYGDDQTAYLEFFVTEPIETLIKKRAAFVAGHQVINTNVWYNGLFCEWNMNDQVMLTPDNHDTLSGFVVYEIASDDPTESRPAYLATKEAVYPVQSEVSALDYFISNFVWGGLQRTTNESESYGIYNIPDWHTLRTNNTLNLSRAYDYPDMVVMYYGMYRVARFHPEITTAMTAQQYLQRAWGTAVAQYTVAGGTQATQTGLMNEMVTPSVIAALQAEGMTNQAATLQGYWEQKVNFFVTGNPQLFTSEFPFDTSGFETQEELASYALRYAGSDAALGSANPSAFIQQAQQFMTNEINANFFTRGYPETAYYLNGSDYRALGGDTWLLSYMAQMGGWGLLDYALNYATNSTEYLRLGYASILSGWATVNSGTPASNYGFWYPGAANDGGAGDGFEASPSNVTWLGQPMDRGLWYYCGEGNLGFCGAVRAAATILADDPIFGRFCYGGTWQSTATNLEIVPLDGVRQRFHAMLNSGALHVAIDTDRFASGQFIVLQPDLSAVGFALETGNPSAHTARLHLSGIAGTYTLSNASGPITNLTLAAGEETTYDLPVPANAGMTSFTLTR